ncbi:PREDICTED: SLAM family member 8 [Gekko japonicus]|uniref:SLAM family member 8 n=1 Tax=Gekko japonicus TaxID=146911 RepID=A0ABM1L6C5_GEKJA|nr:PREDICTED: SLAM family member 8 [Gekko japonicus]
MWDSPPSEKHKGISCGKNERPSITGWPHECVTDTFPRTLCVAQLSSGVMGLFLLTLVLQSVLAVLARAPVRVLGIEGQPVFLKANVPPGFHVRDTIWRFLTPVEELVAVSFKGTPQILYQSRFYGRSRLHTNFTLEICPAALGDSGIFSALLVNTTGEMEKQIFHLEVYGTIPRRMWLVKFMQWAMGKASA